MRSIMISFLLVVGCGAEGPPGPQGVEGPQGPAGSGSGGKFTWSVPDNLGDHFVILGGGNPRPTFTFDLTTQVPTLPTMASAIYVEVNGCEQSGDSPGPIEFKTATSVRTTVKAEQLCNSSNERITAKQVWVPSSSPHQITATATGDIGAATSGNARVRVLAWYEP